MVKYSTMEKGPHNIETEFPDPEYFSPEIQYCIEENGGLDQIFRNTIYQNLDIGFQIIKATLVFKTGKFKELPEPITCLPIPEPKWILVRGYSPSWDFSIWKPLSQAKKDIADLVGHLKKPHYGLAINQIIDQKLTNYPLQPGNFSYNLQSFIGEFQQIQSVTRFDITYKTGESKKFPEPLIILPSPNWVGVTGFEPGSWTEPVWMTKSEAVEESQKFIDLINTCQFLSRGFL